MEIRIRESIETITYRIKHIDIVDEDGEILSTEELEKEEKDREVDIEVAEKHTIYDPKKDKDNVYGLHKYLHNEKKINYSGEHIEQLYLRAMEYNKTFITHTIVTWPDSQIYMDKPWFEKEAELINDDLGLKLFGPQAFIIPIKKL